MNFNLTRTRDCRPVCVFSRNTVRWSIWGPGKSHHKKTHRRQCQYGLSSSCFSEINQLAYRSVATLLVDFLTLDIYTCHLSPSKINSVHFLALSYVKNMLDRLITKQVMLTPHVSFSRRARFGVLLMRANADSTEQQRRAISRISSGCVYVEGNKALPS